MGEKTEILVSEKRCRALPLQSLPIERETFDRIQSVRHVSHTLSADTLALGHQVTGLLENQVK